ncbi:MAG: hypothetical protein R3C02_13545 [Planctomycetaceae bacterium]
MDVAVALFELVQFFEDRYGNSDVVFVKSEQALSVMQDDIRVENKQLWFRMVLSNGCRIAGIRDVLQNRCCASLQN